MAQTEDARTEAAAPEPRGELSIRTLAMPADTNQNGDIFGGWVLGQMDVAGGIFASKIARPLRDHRGRRHDVPQAGLRRRRGVRPCRPDSDRHNLHHGAGRGLGHPRNQTDRILVTQGNFTYVAIDEKGRPRHVKR